MIRPVDKNSYHIPRSGHPMLHEELAWYATADDVALGVVIRDRVDDDFSWVVLTKADDGYRAIDTAVSRPNIELATAELHAAMERYHGR